MAGEDIDVEGVGYGCVQDQVGNELVYPRIRFLCIAVGILLTSPKAEGKNLVCIGIRNEENLVHEPRLVFKNWENIIANCVRQLSHFSGLGRDSNDSGKHGDPPFLKFIDRQRQVESCSIAKDDFRE